MGRFRGQRTQFPSGFPGTTAQLVYAYDLADRITQITYPSGRIVQYLRDTKGRANLVQTKATSSVTTWTMLADSFTYEPFAAVKAMRFGNGLVAANDWGNDSRLASPDLKCVRRSVITHPLAKAASV